MEAILILLFFYFFIFIQFSGNITDSQKFNAWHGIYLMQHAANSFHVNHRQGSSSVKSAWIWQLLQHHHSGSASYLQHKESQVRFVTNIKTWLGRFLFQVHIKKDISLKASLNTMQLVPSLTTTTTTCNTLTAWAASREQIYCMAFVSVYTRLYITLHFLLFSFWCIVI